MEKWFWMVIIAIVLWGLGSFFGKLATIKDIPSRVYFFEAMGTLATFTCFMLWKRHEIFHDFSINVYGLLMGISWGVGTVLFIVALKPAKLSVLVPLTAVYPIVTVVLSYIFLHERLETREMIGVILAIVSAVLLAR